jgi:hypothetical protein
MEGDSLGRFWEGVLRGVQGCHGNPTDINSQGTGQRSGSLESRELLYVLEIKDGEAVGYAIPA